MSLPNNNNGFGTPYTKAFRVINTLVNAENSLTGVELTGAEPYTSLNLEIAANTGAGTFTLYDNFQTIAGGVNTRVGGLYITNAFLINGASSVSYTLNAYNLVGALLDSKTVTPSADNENAVFLNLAAGLVSKITVTTSAVQEANINSTISVMGIRLPGTQVVA